MKMYKIFRTTRSNTTEKTPKFFSESFIYNLKKVQFKEQPYKRKK